MTQKIPWIGTGWKMNKLRADAVAFANTLKASAIANTASAQTFVLPPFPYIAEVAGYPEGHARQSRRAEHALGRAGRLDR